MFSGFVVGAIGGAVIVAIVGIIAALRKISAKTVAQTRRRMTLTSPLAPAAVIEKLKRAAWRKIKVTDTDADRGVVVLATPMTMFSWGFFYPVFVTQGGSGSTIEVGIKSRAMQWGPVVTNNHKACVAEIEQALKA